MSKTNIFGQNKPDGRHLKWIVEFRGILALFVLLHHAFLNTTIQSDSGPTWNILHDIFGHGHFRVDIFFVLSGYCLALSLKGDQRLESFPKFITRRSIRLLVPYFLALAITLILIRFSIGAPTGTHWDESLPTPPASIITHILMIHNWWPEYATNLNHPLWSIAVEYQLYFCFPALLWLHRKVGNWKAWTIASLLGYAAWEICRKLDIANPSPYGVSFYYVSLFSMGIASAQFKIKDTRTKFSDRAFIVGIVTLMAAWWVLQFVKSHHHVEVQVQAFFVGLATFIALRHGAISAALGSIKVPFIHRFLQIIGERSYSIYLLHAPMLQLAWLYAVSKTHIQSAAELTVVEMSVGFVLTIAAAEVFYRLIEKPSHKLSQTLSNTFRPKVALSS